MIDLLYNHLTLFFVVIATLFVIGLLLGLAHAVLKKEPAIIENINKILPQTQCGQCGYPGCKPYAQAIAKGDEINKCPPGGQEVIEKIALLINKEAIALAEEEKPKRIAIIREAECIGCTLCIQACPVDAIVGAQKKMHTVITDFCTGCDLCIPPCPVECIDMIDINELPDIDNYTKIHTS